MKNILPSKGMRVICTSPVTGEEKIGYVVGTMYNEGEKTLIKVRHADTVNMKDELWNVVNVEVVADVKVGDSVRHVTKNGAESLGQGTVLSADGRQIRVKFAKFTHVIDIRFLRLAR